MNSSMIVIISQNCQDYFRIIFIDDYLLSVKPIPLDYFLSTHFKQTLLFK